ncbi:MAG: pyridoxamine 5'-phosphate oxidase family protein [Haliea sp.]|uniref:pyridoxamine 5'-phosphate oxidase family protein n=1 Tax=Marinobacter salarius TaxID=1420917 RepID=UPI0032EBFFED
MGHSYHDIAFTPTVADLQSAMGSRKGYAAMGAGGQRNHLLSERERDFIARRDSFYLASVSETGWPYLQHRGGPPGFMKVLDENTLGFADYSGNRQYVSTGNFINNNRVSLFLMDYPNQRRLKILGHVQIVSTGEEDILALLEDPDYPARVERGFLIHVEGFDWNCPQHITRRFTEAEVQSLIQTLQEDKLLQRADAEPVEDRSAAWPAVVGVGPLELVITGVRQLTPHIRAYELRDPEGRELPPLEAGAHLVVPVLLDNGELSDRHYSIASNPARRDAYEIAVFAKPDGRGGSAALHRGYRLGLRLRAETPANHFALHADPRPALLIAGGIGITAIKSMALALAARDARFELHYAGRSHSEMAYRDQLQRQLGERLFVYSAADGERLDLDSLLRAAGEDTVIYLCGPDRLVTGALRIARKLNIPGGRLRLERFN